MRFGNWRAYSQFSDGVRYKGRFALGPNAQWFLDVFRHQAQARRRKLAAGTTLFRAVCHHDEVLLSDGTIDIRPAIEDRIRPKADKVSDGRVNAKGITCLYLASSIDTAVSEIRPWLGELVSVATFRTNRAYSLVDLSEHHGSFGVSRLTFGQLLGEEPISAEQADECVWTDIDNAFSRPVSNSDTSASYLPTQILAEALKESGYDGVVYKSSFGGEKGYNVALFDGTETTIIKCALHRIKAISVDHVEDGNAWYRRSDEAKS
jgi:RES domain-containing protein